VSAISVRIPLDGNGNVSGTVKLWVNSTLTPAGSFYIVDAFDSNGEQAWRTSQFLMIPASPSPYDLGTAVLNSPVPAGPANSSTFQTNGVNNSVQSLLDLVAGTNITLSNSNGHTTITAGGGAAGSFFFGPGLIDNALLFGTGAVGTSVSPGISNGVTAANVVTVYKFSLPMSFSISKITSQCTDNLAGQTATFGIYSEAGSLLVDGGKFTTIGSGGIVTNTITPVTLPAGVYWHAQAINAASVAHYPGVAISSGSIISGFIVPFWVKNSTKVGNAANILSSGNLPATLGVITPFTPTGVNGDGICCPLYE